MLHKLVSVYLARLRIICTSIQTRLMYENERKTFRNKLRIESDIFRIRRITYSSINVSVYCDVWS